MRRRMSRRRRRGWSRAGASGRPGRDVGRDRAQAVDRRAHVAGVEGAGDLQRDDPRARPGGSALSAARASSAPATTIWPPPLKLAGSRPSSSRRARSSASSAPRTALMPVGDVRGGVGHRPAALGDEAHRVGFGEHAGAGGRGDLADGVPGDAADCARHGRRRAARRASRMPAATMSGWATAVSRMVSASDSVPCATRSSPAASEMHRRAARRSGLGEPGSEESGGLRALSRADDDDHHSSLPIVGRRGCAHATSSRRKSLCERYRSGVS